MVRGFTTQITYLVTQAESLFIDVLSNHTCTGIINDKTMPHNIYIKYKIRIQCIGARTYTNNLPLALVPIRHNSKTEWSNMILIFWHSQLLGQRICYIVLSRNLAYLHISSLDDLSNEMESPEYVFGSLVWPGLLGLCDGPAVITIKLNWI